MPAEELRDKNENRRDKKRVIKKQGKAEREIERWREIEKVIAC